MVCADTVHHRLRKVKIDAAGVRLIAAVLPQCVALQTLEYVFEGVGPRRTAMAWLTSGHENAGFVSQPFRQQFRR